MNNDLWLNLPSKDLAKARAFFTQMGMTINERQSNAQMLSIVVGGNKVVVNLFTEAMFQGIAGAAVADTSKVSETLISIGAGSRAEVDAIAAKAQAAGGTVFGKPAEVQGWMYGCGFTDTDGHRWNVLNMDMSRMPKS